MKFDERTYLDANPDVAEAVRSGQFKSGFAHYRKHGRFEQRRGTSVKCQRPVFFCHLPKTAGTSLRKALECIFPEWAVVPDRLMISRHDGLYPPAEIFRPSLQYQGTTVGLVRGHYHISLAQVLADPITIAVLREPVARTISNIKNGIRNGLPLEIVHARLDAGLLPVETNLMTRYMGGTSTGYSPIFGQIGEDELAGAVARLARIECLGVVERMDEALSSIGNALGVPIDLECDNASGEMDLGLSPSQMDVIARHNDLDRRLYEATVKEIDARR